MAGLVFLRARDHVAPSTQGAAARKRATLAFRRRDRTTTRLWSFARDEWFFGTARAGDTRTDLYASRRASTGTALRPLGDSLPVDPEITRTAFRRSDRESRDADHSARRPPAFWSGNRAARAAGWTLRSRGCFGPGNWAMATLETGPTDGFRNCGSRLHPSGLTSFGR